LRLASRGARKWTRIAPASAWPVDEDGTSLVAKRTVKMMHGVTAGMATSKPYDWWSTVTRLTFGKHVYAVATDVHHLARRWHRSSKLGQSPEVTERRNSQQQSQGAAQGYEETAEVIGQDTAHDPEQTSYCSRNQQACSIVAQQG
jgi:hypothetical protein